MLAAPLTGLSAATFTIVVTVAGLGAALLGQFAEKLAQGHALDVVDGVPGASAGNLVVDRCLPDSAAPPPQARA